MLHISWLNVSWTFYILTYALAFSTQTHRAASSRAGGEILLPRGEPDDRRQFLGNARADFPEALAENLTRDFPGIFANLAGQNFYNGSKLP